MNIDFNDIPDYLRENLFTVLPIALVVLIVIGYIVFTARTVLPRWRLRTELVTQSEAVEAAYAERLQQQQGNAGQLEQQIAAAEAEFAQAVNQFLTEAQAAEFLDGLYGLAAANNVFIVDFQAQAVPQGAPVDGEKPIFDTRQFRLIVEGELAQLTTFVGSIEAPVVPGLNLRNLLIIPSDSGQSEILSLDLLLYTSPFATGEFIAQSPEESLPQPTSPAAVPAVPATPAPTVPPTPDVGSLAAQLDESWAAEDWPQVIALIQEIRQIDPNNQEMTEKLYAARVNYGYQLIGLGETAAAAEQFEQALAIFPEGVEAEAGLQSILEPAPTATPATVIHVVVRGDTLFSIARRYGSTVDAVKAANGLTSNNISPGQQLIIP